MELLAEIFGITLVAILLVDFLFPGVVEVAFVSLFGAFVGILYPPQSRAWARAQKLAIALLCAAVTLWAAAYAAAKMLGSGVVPWSLTIFGIALFLGYLAIGNTCRIYHEQH
jgi:hypothetical protein